MSYVQCKDGFITKGRALTALFPSSKPWTVSDDEQNIRKGSDYFIVTIPSTFTSVRADARSKYMTWIVLFDFYVRFTTKLESTRKFEVGRDLILTHYHSDPWLLKTPGVEDVLINAAGEVLQDTPGDNPNFIIQTMSAAIRQRVIFQF